MKRSRRPVALIQIPPAKHSGTTTSHATGTTQPTSCPTPRSTTAAAAQVAKDTTAHRIVSSAMTRALARCAGSPASRRAQKSTDRPPIAVATLKAPKANPTIRRTVGKLSRGPPSRDAIAW